MTCLLFLVIQRLRPIQRERDRKAGRQTYITDIGYRQRYTYKGAERDRHRQGQRDKGGWQR
jgi:hypothetical protein